MDFGKYYNQEWNLNNKFKCWWSGCNNNIDEFQYAKGLFTLVRHECWNTTANFPGIFKAMTKNNSITFKDSIRTRFYVTKVGEKSNARWIQL